MNLQLPKTIHKTTTITTTTKIVRTGTKTLALEGSISNNGVTIITISKLGRIISRIGETITTNKTSDLQTQIGNHVVKIGTTTTTQTSLNLDKSTAITATNSAISSHNVCSDHNQPTYQLCHTINIPTPSLCQHSSFSNNKPR